MGVTVQESKVRNPREKSNVERAGRIQGEISQSKNDARGRGRERDAGAGIPEEKIEEALDT